MATYCYNIFAEDYENEGCYSSTDVGCTVSLNGTTCNSCELVNCTGLYEVTEDFAWDCTNVPGGNQGSNCNEEEFFLPKLANCLMSRGSTTTPPSDLVSSDTPAPTPSANITTMSPTPSQTPPSMMGPMGAVTAVPSEPSNMTNTTSPGPSLAVAPVVMDLNDTFVPSTTPTVAATSTLEPTNNPIVVTRAPDVTAAPPDMEAPMATPSTSGSHYYYCNGAGGSSFVIVANCLVAVMSMALAATTV